MVLDRIINLAKSMQTSDLIYQQKHSRIISSDKSKATERAYLSNAYCIRLAPICNAFCRTGSGSL